jgi:hypothetical protein
MTLPPRSAGVPCEKDAEPSFSPQGGLATSVHMQMHTGSAGIVRAVRRAAGGGAP